MKIAVCFFGNIGRIKAFSQHDFNKHPHIDLLMPYKHFTEYIIRPNFKHNIDIFLHSSSPEFEQLLINLYSPVNYEFKENHFPEPPVNRFSKDAYNHKRYFYAALSRFWSTKRVIELKSEYEKIHNFKYDLVFLLRYDLIFLKHLYLDRLDTNKLNIQYNSFDDKNCPKIIDAIGDWFFISNSDLINEFSLAYDNLPELVRCNKCYGLKKYNQHGLCYQQLNNMFIDIDNNINLIMDCYNDHTLHKFINNKEYIDKRYKKFKINPDTGLYEKI